jgi:hypothetical protein
MLKISYYRKKKLPIIEMSMKTKRSIISIFGNKCEIGIT